MFCQRAVLFGLMLLVSGCHREQLLQGYIEADEIKLSAPLAGRLESLHVKRGDRVTKDAKLFDLSLYPETFSQAISQANHASSKAHLIDLLAGPRQSQLDSASDRLEQARLEAQTAHAHRERMIEQYRSGYLSRDAFDRVVDTSNAAKINQSIAKNDLNDLQSGTRQAQLAAQRSVVKAQQIEMARWQWLIDQKSAVAPRSGQVADIYFHEGEQVPAFSPILSIFDQDHLRVVFFIPRAQLPKLKKLKTITVRCSGCAPTQQSEATVNFIATQLSYTPPMIFNPSDNGRFVFEVHATLAMPSGFHPGQPVNILLDTLAVS